MPEGVGGAGRPPLSGSR